MRWKPNLTVAAAIEQDGRFLLVEEAVAGRRVLNQPAGHLEPGEGVQDAVIREVLEETGRHFRPEALVGVYRWSQPGSDTTFLRFAFAGECSERGPTASLDPAILDTLWLTREEIALREKALRSPLVRACIGDYLRGKRFSLDLLREIP